MTIIPKELTLMITNACNCRCSYCCERGIDNPYEAKCVSKDVIRKCIDILAPVDHGFLAMFGGEATLNMDLLEYSLKYFKDNYLGSTLKFGITTNGVNLTDRVIQWMKDVSDVTDFEVLISLDGCKESHDRYRKTVDGRPTFDIVLDNIKKLNRVAPNVKISRHAVLSKYDMRHMHDVSKVTIEVAKYCFSQTFAFLMLGPRSSTSEEYDRDDFEAYISFYYKHVHSDNSDIFDKEELKAVRRMFQVGVGMHPRDRHDGRMWESCHAGYDEFLVDVDGIIYPCVKYYSELAGTNFPTLNVMDFNPTLTLPDDHHYMLYKKHHDDQESFVARFTNENGDSCANCPAMALCSWCIGHGECHTGNPYIRPNTLCDRFLMFSEIDAEYQLEYVKKLKNDLILRESKLMYDIETGTKIIADQVVKDNICIRNEMSKDEY